MKKVLSMVPLVFPLYYDGKVACFFDTMRPKQFNFGGSYEFAHLSNVALCCKCPRLSPLSNSSQLGRRSNKVQT